MAVYDEIEELKGRLIALNVKYPDMSVRLDDSIDALNRVVFTPGMMQYVITDLTGLLVYFKELYVIEELRRELKPVIDLIETLLAPA